MTHEMCRHYTVDGSAYCDRCKDEWYVGTAFTMNDLDYRVEGLYGTDPVTSEDFWSCKLIGGQGYIHITSADIDNATSQTPYWLPQPCWHDEY